MDRNEIMQVVWPGIFVSDDNIAQCVKEIRHVLGDGDQRILRTVPRRGFLLAVPISVADPATTEVPLRALPVPPPPPGRTPLVVLPFDGIGGDPDEEYFAQGLTADLVTDLTKFQELYILSPPRQADKLSRSKPMWDEAPSAGHYFFKGNVRRAGGRIRVTAQMGEVQQGVGKTRCSGGSGISCIKIVAETDLGSVVPIVGVVERLAQYIALRHIGQGSQLV